MPLAYEFDDRVVVIRLEGEYATADVEDTIVIATADPACPRDAVFLFDMRRSRAVLRRPLEEVRATARFVATRGARFGGRLGMVAEGDAALARMRLAQSMMRTMGVAAEAFADIEVARQWLLSDSSVSAQTAASGAFARAQLRAATGRQGSARCISDRGTAWCVVSEQPRGADRWELVVEWHDGERRLSDYPPQWMLLPECELLDLIGTCSATDDRAARCSAATSVFAMRLDGFEAAVSYDEAAEEFRGEVLNSRAALQFSGRTVDELRSAFRAVVESARDGRGTATRRTSSL